MTEQDYRIEQQYLTIQQTFELLKYDIEAIRMTFDQIIEEPTNPSNKVMIEQVMNLLQGHINDLKKDCTGW